MNLQKQLKLIVVVILQFWLEMQYISLSEDCKLQKNLKK
jgi:hypothetical protein